ncbi:hypothetical protein Cadr_000028937 [Camelus dromedarius]|uniref:Uncharacterized protein n=1 Tax=Camelus dromedarius TaxID=9838 RepID=A0A5N4C7E2_CAMDR|nr:hypothetical protein Cadr_000028937 [Camelus dromedarius]
MGLAMIDHVLSLAWSRIATRRANEEAMAESIDDFIVKTERAKAGCLSFHPERHQKRSQRGRSQKRSAPVQHNCPECNAPAQTNMKLFKSPTLRRFIMAHTARLRPST